MLETRCGYGRQLAFRSRSRAFLGKTKASLVLFRSVCLCRDTRCFDVEPVT